MNRIKKLDAATAGKIAAGEVVEKPAMVVKELVENAIDAGATEIVVDVKKGGKDKIRVTDNGAGIHEDDLPLLFERHATSKIQTIDDLYATRTLGFRGEALASICAVSQMEVITMREGSSSGTCVRAAGGRILEKTDIGTVVGTSIAVSDLFFNTPARLKFLKADATEGRYITELMNHLALSHPEIAFKYLLDDKLIFRTSGKDKLKDAIFGVYDAAMTKSLYEIEETLDDISLRGFVSKFDYTKGTRSYQIAFVNGRYVKSDFIKDIVQMAYKPYMMHNRHPVCFLFFDMPPEKLDVNIHPAKTEIKFHEEGKVKQVLYTALKKAFNLYDQSPSVTFTEKDVFTKKAQAQTLKPEAEKRFEFIETQSRDMPVRQEVVTEAPVAEKPPVTPLEPALKRPSTSGGHTGGRPYTPPPKPSVDFDAFEQIGDFIKENADLVETSIYDGLHYIGTFDRTYLLFEKASVLYMVDQHAAHEKVLYEMFMKAFEEQSVLSQMLLVPETLELDTLTFQRLDSCSALLTRMGFEYDIFGEGTVVIRAIPSFMQFGIAKLLFLEALEGYAEGMDELIQMRLASKACKAAIKANDALAAVEVSGLLDQLKGLDDPYTCPHGRPIVIKFSKYELEKKFKRIV